MFAAKGTTPVRVEQDGSQFDQLFTDGDSYRWVTSRQDDPHPWSYSGLYGAFHQRCGVHWRHALYAGRGTARADFPGGDARTLYRQFKRFCAAGHADICFTDYAPGRAFLKPRLV